MDKLEALRVFVRVVECESFTRAAETLRIPRSTVSMAIKELENRVGARLLARTTRIVAPTNDGKAFYEHCLRLIADFDEVDALFRVTAAGLRGHLKVNVPGRIGRLIIAPALPEFVAKYPHITLELGVTDRTVDLNAEGIDCVVRAGELADSDLIARRVGDLAIVNCASKSYIEKFGAPRSVRDLKRHRAVGYIPPGAGRPEPWEYVTPAGARFADLPSAITVDNAETLIACCVAGLGLIQAPLYDVREYIGRGELVEVLPRQRPAPMPIHIVYPHRRHLSGRLQAFIEWASRLLRSQACA